MKKLQPQQNSTNMLQYQFMAANQMLGEVFTQNLALRAENMALRASLEEMQNPPDVPPE